MKKLLLLLAVLSTVILFGCAPMKKDKPLGAEVVPEKTPEEAPEEAAKTTGVTDQGAVTAKAVQEQAFAGHVLDDPKSPLYTKVIYFEYDKSDINPEFLDIIAAHAKYLSANPNARVTLEGHADERGSREYNIALGERRANTVRQTLLLQSVGKGQLKSVSYGEERPADMGHDEAAMAKNRRVELVYTAR
ncbi:MAG: peptidoglycan-associated lipoprotein [Gammaproteobacteria bacterium RBG_16_57_12]|nr:MAG: peptidoglycan-associated lipoprotein [Gammaproteobacteria bacterium RBG_16_57_12]